MFIAALYMIQNIQNWKENPEWEELRGVERGGIHDQNILNENLLNKNK